MGVPDETREEIESDPYAHELGIELVELSPGKATARLEIMEKHLNFHGMPHGGAIYSLADTAFAAASNSYGETAVALETNISYLSAVDEGTVLVATAEETHATKRTAEYEIVVRKERDKNEEPIGGERVATFRGRVYKP